MKNKRIVSCAITGSIHVPSLSIYLPLTPEKIAQEALDAAEAGAAVVHIHARDPKNGRPSADLKLFEQIVNTIRSKNKDVIICLTTGGSLDMTIEQRAAVIPALKPELASMNAGSINWGLFPLVNKIKEWRFDWEKPWLEWTSNAIFQNTFQQMMDMLRFFNKNGTKPELECYD
ncbi:3-keto-5-aminohexanoate cleavage protein, partial [bacterium]|nr:3-keto-5-aminohexanoate cleavage protein [bacterium]